MYDDSKMSRVARKRARVRANLLAAARQVFAQRGYQEATIAEITAAADVAVGTFYLHFQDKEEVFSTLVEEGFQILCDHVRAVVEQHPAEQYLPLLVRTLLQQAYQQRDLFFMALFGGGRFARTFQGLSHLAQLLEQALETAKREGELGDYDSELLARLVTGTISHGIAWWFEHEEPGPDVVAEHILYLLQHGLPQRLFNAH
ncbi:MAG: TetR/AcrR family transcriptional regulator [Ktedonobacteraceae bacterium]|nr:TetR/AcrR family transcriptional regulator [Ktedonobacteraceae bacterium]